MNSETSQLPPLCVDLDGTLIRSDLLVESLLLLLKARPWLLLALPWWLLRGGKAHLKRQIARRVRLDPATLPYNEELLAYLREARAAGRELVLATASDDLLARPVADHLGLFTRVETSDGRANLSGVAKARHLRERLGAVFDYVGDHCKDIPVWEAAREALLVDRGGRLARRLADNGRIRLGRVFGTSRGLGRRLALYLRALRLHQWAKNTLVFIPLLTSYHLTDAPLLLNAVLAFLAFGLVASAVYVVNDLLDLAADRAHPRKSRRPFAAGDLPLLHGLLLAPLLIALGFGLSLALLPRGFSVTLAAYLAVTTAYSFYLKRKFGLDVLTLAGLYTVRIFAGAAAIGVVVSDWLLAFSMFFFMSLALVKRFSELHALAQRAGEGPAGRGYFVADLPLVANIGVSTGMIAVLVLVLYLHEQIGLGVYAQPAWMWLLCPIIAHWLLRVWVLAWRGQMDEDPVVFAVRDRQSQLAALLILAAAWLAI